jgi:Phytanoyl-CoA dioxygenase (PhyH)
VWTDEQRHCFEQTGILRLPSAFPRAAADAMLDAVWRYLERRSGLRRDDATTWEPPPISFKNLKRNRAFGPLVDNPSVHSALDGIFGAGRWSPSKKGPQVLTTVPTAPPWILPHHLWHMDSNFERPTWPTFAVKLFGCIAPLQPGGGATLAISGSHRLVERYAPTLEADQMGGNQIAWGRFMKQDPWLSELRRPGPEPERTRRLVESRHDANGVDVGIVEMHGEPGDVFITHLHVFHCASPNVASTPRMALATFVAASGPDI